MVKVLTIGASQPASSFLKRTLRTRFRPGLWEGVDLAQFQANRPGLIEGYRPVDRLLLALSPHEVTPTARIVAGALAWHG